MMLLKNSSMRLLHRASTWEILHFMDSPLSRSGVSAAYKMSVGRYGPVMTDSSRLQQHHTTSDDPGQDCKAHEGGIRP